MNNWGSDLCASSKYISMKSILMMKLRWRFVIT